MGCTCSSPWKFRATTFRFQKGFRPLDKCSEVEALPGFIKGSVEGHRFGKEDAIESVVLILGPPLSFLAKPPPCPSEFLLFCH